MLLLRSSHLASRRALCVGALAPLFESLRSELDAAIGRGPEIPRVKALLSRAGGRCENDGTVLEFDPWSPRQHRCPTCNAVHEGELHHRAWVTSYQLWLAERCLHAALLHLLRGDAGHAAFARDTLREYAERYLEYPNSDNVLGPTRLFFSTYLESIWLLQICVASSALSEAGDATTADLVRNRIVAPSSALIAEYDEGMSNRQVWNNAALLASAILLGDEDLAGRVVHGPSGLEAHLSHALLADGTWYEGENYHQFALRGLWYGVMLCEASGRVIRSDLVERFHRAFVAPFITALPDFTMPSRKDSQYAVSLRQWRVAETTELGFARAGDPRLAGALARCYEEGHQRRDTGRSRSTADVERNTPASALTRADLGWRALLHARAELPPLREVAPRSALLEQQGIAVFRRSPDVYTALDYGQSGGGHGHPDRLNVMLSLGATRVLDDLGTGSYVDPSLHWYRSTLAHNAPLVNGESQPLHDGELRAYEEGEGLGWVVAEFDVHDTRLERAVVVAPDYLIDELSWESPSSVRLDLPWHMDAHEHGLELTPFTLDGGGGLEDGFEFVRDARVARVAAGAVVTLASRDSAARVQLVCSGELAMYFACAPGQPSTETRRFVVARTQGAAGRMRAVVSWSSEPPSVEFGDAVAVTLNDVERHVHRRDAKGWHVELFAGAARSGVDLAGWRPKRAPQPAPAAPRAEPIVLRRTPLGAAWLSEIAGQDRQHLFTRELGEESYRRSEHSWSGAGSPRADIAIGATPKALVVFAHVRAGDPHFARSDAVNPYDNEHADTMAAGFQVYARTPNGTGAWTLVPEADSDHVRVRSIAGWGDHPLPKARWRRSPDGYEMRIELPLPHVAEYPVDLDLLINETTADRVRRRGQLVLSGGGGEFVYLRGDRHEASRLLPLVIVA